MTQVQRNTSVDLIRCFALVAICIVNLPFIVRPPELALLPGITIADQLGAFITESLLQLKFYLLFAFVFGWSVVRQAEIAQLRGIDFKGRYFRRMAVLGVLGGLHAVLVFNGDILLLYALLGLLLWPIRQWPLKKLARLALTMLPLSAACLTLLALALDALPASDVPLPDSAAPGYLQLTAERLTDWPATFVFLLLLQAPLAFAAFICGLIAARAHWLVPGSQAMQHLQHVVPLLLLIGLPLNLLFGAVSSGIVANPDEWLSFFALLSLGLAAPALAAVYLYCLVRMSWRIAVGTLWLRAGQNSLSVYVLQGVLAGWLAGSYGLGLYGQQLNQLQLIPIGITIALCAMLVVSVYARWAGKGPLEQLLRRISD